MPSVYFLLHQEKRQRKSMKKKHSKAKEKNKQKKKKKIIIFTMKTRPEELYKSYDRSPNSENNAPSLLHATPQKKGKKIRNKGPSIFNQQKNYHLKLSTSALKGTGLRSSQSCMIVKEGVPSFHRQDRNNAMARPKQLPYFPTARQQHSGLPWECVVSSLLMKKERSEGGGLGDRPKNTSHLSGCHGSGCVMAEQQLTTNAHSRVSGQLLLRHHTSLAYIHVGDWWVFHPITFWQVWRILWRRPRRGRRPRPGSWRGRRRRRPWTAPWRWCPPVRGWRRGCPGRGGGWRGARRWRPRRRCGRGPCTGWWGPSPGGSGTSRCTPSPTTAPPAPAGPGTSLPAPPSSALHPPRSPPPQIYYIPRIDWRWLVIARVYEPWIIKAMAKLRHFFSQATPGRALQDAHLWHYWYIFINSFNPPAGFVPPPQKIRYQ